MYWEVILKVPTWMVLKSLWTTRGLVCERAILTVGRLVEAGSALSVGSCVGGEVGLAVGEDVGSDVGTGVGTRGTHEQI